MSQSSRASTSPGFLYIKDYSDDVEGIRQRYKVFRGVYLAVKVRKGGIR